MAPQPGRSSVEVMLDPLDLYGLKRSFARTNELGDLLRETADPAFLRRARRALLPLPWIEHPPAGREPAARAVPPRGRSRRWRASAWR